MAHLTLHLFGSPRIEVDGVPVEVDTRKATALLAYLVVTRQTHQRDSLVALLWPDYDQTSARAALRRTLSTLNHALSSHAAASGEENSFLEITRETLALARDANLWVDVDEFERSLASLATHGHAGNEICPSCLKALEHAVAVYSEPFMAGFNLRDSANFEDWQFFQEESQRRALSGALEKLVHGLEAGGDSEEAILYARRWLALDPLNEEAHRQLMLLYARSDQRNAALRQYRECVRVLDQELSVAPLDETTRLYQSILNRELLPQSESRLRFITAVEAKTPHKIAPGAAAEAPEPARLSEAAAPAHPLIGRKAELAQMRAAYSAVRQDGRLITLEGEAGIGKTRLSLEFLDWARTAGAVVAQAGCYPGETGLAYAPFIQALGTALAQPQVAERLKLLPPGVAGEAARLLPGLSDRVEAQQPAGTTADGGQARFFESLRQVIIAIFSGPVPGVLFLDDLHWADAATLELLAYLARRLKGAGLCILAAWRDQPGETNQSLAQLAAEQSRGGRAARLRLSRLDAAEVTALVRAFPGAGGASPEALAARLYQESEGLPFVAVEYLSALSSRGAGEAWEMPASVRDLLRSRLSGLPEMAQQLVSAAAVIGRSFDFNILREASGRSEIEAVDGLDQLLAAGLVIEQAAPEIRYDFTHEKLRALIYEETSLARRRLLHRRIAEALARLPGGSGEPSGSNAALIAYHYEQAGQDAQAAEFHRIAGERALRLFANQDALTHFQAALAAGHPDAAGLHESIGDLQTLRGEYAGAITSYHTAAALCTPGCLANLEHKLGNVHHRLGAWDLAESHYQASLESAGEAQNAGTAQNAGSPFHVHLLAELSMLAYARGQIEKAQALAGQALELARSVPDPHALAQAYNALGVIARARGDQPAALEALEASLRAAEQLDDPLARIAALNNLALAHGETGNLEESIRLAEQALALCQHRGDRHRQAALHNNLADLLHRAGREEEAMEQLKQAVVIFAEIGAPAESASAEVWKLTEW